MTKYLTKRLYYIVLLLGLISCSEDEDYEPTFGGSYTGYYYISTPTTRQLPIALTVEFDLGNYTGHSEDSVYHSVFMGQFTVDGNQVSLTNGFNAVEKSQWKRIMTGTYRYELIDETINMSRDLQDGGIEGFRLTKE